MKKTILFTILIMSMLLAACSTGRSMPTIEPFAVAATEQLAEPTAVPITEATTAPAETANADLDALTATTWMWTGFTDPTQQYDVESPGNYTLAFQDDGTVNIKADCNNAFGAYTVDGSSLTIEVGPMTRAACPPESRSDDFVKYLGSVAIYFFDGNDLFIDLMADGGTMRFSSYGENSGNDQLTTMGIDVNAEPFSGELFLGGGEERWLDPTLISALGGASEGPGINAGDLGPACNVYIPFRPDVVVNWEGQENVENLKFFFLSMGDPSMVLVTPSGKVLCNDDLNPLVLDPYIEIKDPEPGRYVVFMGNYENDAIYPGFLVVTSHDVNPATMDLAQLFPRQVDPRGVPQTISTDVLDLKNPDVAAPPGGQLSSADLPYAIDLTTGGEIGAFNLDQPNQLCTGFISAAPSFKFEWKGEPAPLVMFFESNVDTTLQVLGPDGTFVCDDDFNGSENINPGLTLTPGNGTYSVWVGSFSPDVQAKGKLTVTNDANAAPVQLTSKDIQN